MSGPNMPHWFADGSIFPKFAELIFADAEHSVILVVNLSEYFAHVTSRNTGIFKWRSTENRSTNNWLDETSLFFRQSTKEIFADKKR